jgi:hypothetical protein
MFGVCSHLVFPLATLAHLNPAHHPNPSVFSPERWQGTNARPAIMSSTSFIPFGLGRWSCPGRALAVSGLATSFRLGYSYSTSHHRDKINHCLSYCQVHPTAGRKQVPDHRSTQYYFRSSRRKVDSGALLFLRSQRIRTIYYLEVCLNPLYLFTCV